MQVKIICISKKLLRVNTNFKLIPQSKKADEMFDNIVFILYFSRHISFKEFFMRKRSFKFTSKVLSLLALHLAFTYIPNYAQAQFSNLSMQANHLEQHHAAATVILPFIEKVNTSLDGVHINYFSLNMLYPESEAYSAINDGRVDFGALRPSLFAGVMNAMTVVEIPGIMQNAIVGSLVSADILDKFPEARAELPQNSVPFAAWTAAAWELHSIKPINTLADIQGKRIIVWDINMLEVAKKLGATPLRIQPFDTYLALSKNQADGVIAPMDPIRSLKLAEVTKHHFILSLGLASFEMAVFKPLWDSFSKEMQEYFLTEGRKKFSAQMGASLEEGANIEIEWLLANGHTVSYPTEEERQKLDTLLASFKDMWLENVQKAGLKNAEEILQYAEERAAFHKANIK